MTASGTALTAPLFFWNNEPLLFIANSVNSNCALSFSGFDITEGLCGISTEYVGPQVGGSGWRTAYGFVSSGTMHPVPGPEVGTGLPALAMAAAGLLLLRTRRRVTAAA